MEIVRAIAHRLILLFLSSLLFFGLVGLAASMTLVDRNNVKDWPKAAGTYELLLNHTFNLIGENDRETLGDKIEAGGFRAKSLSDAFKAGVSPEYLEQQTENVIDGYYNWLEGKTSEPKYRFSLLERRSAVVKSLAKEISAQYAKLPPCSPGEAIEASVKDIFEQSCRIPGAGSQTELQAELDDQLGPVFSELRFTDKDLKLSDGIKQNLPFAFQALTWLPWAFGGLVLLAFALAALTVKPRFRAIGQVGWSFMSTGILALLSFAFLSQLERLTLPIGKVEGPAATQDAITAIIKPLFRVITEDIARAGLLLSLLFILIGVLMIAVFLVMRRSRLNSGGRVKKRTILDDDHDDYDYDPTPDDEPEPEPEPNTPKPRPKAASKRRPRRSKFLQ